jgi:threonine dehydratase
MSTTTQTPKLASSPGNPEILPTRTDIEQAYSLIANAVHRTPVMHSRYINSLVGAEIYFKCEHLQAGGAFKYRGASHVMRLLTEEEKERGVITHSSGNHAQAVALSAQRLGIKATIVMPKGSNPLKKTATQGYGARVIECENSQASREQTCSDEIERTGMVLIHPFDDHRIICGAGTAALELEEQVPGLDMVVTPVGGGGLLSGTATALHNRIPVYGSEPTGASDAHQGFTTGIRVASQTPNTIADGLRTCVGVRNFEIIRKKVEAIGLTTDAELLEATSLVHLRMKQLIEPSSAVPLACLLNGSIPKASKIGIIISGGNVDLKDLMSRMP